MIQNKYKLHVSSIIIIGLILSICVSYIINSIENEAIENKFQNIVNDKVRSFHTEILLNIETLYSMSILFNNGKVPNENQFKKEAKAIIARHDAIQALEWIPKVSHEERTKYEKEFFFTKQLADKSMVKIEKKPYYLPVYYLEPLRNNKEALGFDLSSDETRNKTIKRSLITKKPQITQAINLVQNKNKKGFLAFLPIFDKKMKEVKGFVLGVFVIEDIFKKSILYDELSKNMSYKIYDITNNKNELIYRYNSLNKDYKYLKYKKNLPILWSKKWTFEVNPSFKYIRERKSLVAELSLIIGILLTIIVSFKLNRFHNLKLESIQQLKNKDEILYIQSRYATIGETLSNIEHQWRSPLSKLSSNIITIQSEIEFKGIPTKEKLQSSLDNMQNTLKYMSNIVDEFKNFHIQDKNKIFFSFNHSLDIALKLLQHDFTKLNLEIIRQKKIESIKLFGYENEFSQVLINILSNCRDIFIERKTNKPLIHILTYKKQNKYFIIIRDNAGGIDKKHIKNIFNQFYSTKNSSGIGLHLSKMIITKHMNGKISVKNSIFYIYSKKCRGATFTIELPII